MIDWILKTALALNQKSSIYNRHKLCEPKSESETCSVSQNAPSWSNFHMVTSMVICAISRLAFSNWPPRKRTMSIIRAGYERSGADGNHEIDLDVQTLNGNLVSSIYQLFINHHQPSTIRYLFAFSDTFFS